MRLDGIDSPHPRQQFIFDLNVWVAELKHKSHDVILMGDCNEEIGIKAKEMATVLQSGDLTDLHCFMHGIQNEDPTYSRGSKRIDYVFAYSRLLPFLLRHGSEPFNSRIFSDHRGLFVDFSLPGFFDRAPNVMARPHQRNLIYESPRHVRLYLEKMHAYFEQHDIMYRLKRLFKYGRDDADAETIDRDITQSMLSADLACKSQPCSPWSQELHQAMTTLHILLRHLSQLKTHIDMSQSISIKQAKLKGSHSSPL